MNKLVLDIKQQYLHILTLDIALLMFNIYFKEKGRKLPFKWKLIYRFVFGESSDELQRYIENMTIHNLYLYTTNDITNENIQQCREDLLHNIQEELKTYCYGLNFK